MNEKEQIELLDSRLDDIPNDGEWWKDSTRDTYLDAGKKLLSYRTAGMTVDEVVEFLQKLYTATAEEFGN